MNGHHTKIVLSTRIKKMNHLLRPTTITRDGFSVKCLLPRSSIPSISRCMLFSTRNTIPHFSPKDATKDSNDILDIYAKAQQHELSTIPHVRENTIWTPETHLTAGERQLLDYLNTSGWLQNLSNNSPNELVRLRNFFFYTQFLFSFIRMNNLLLRRIILYNV